MTSIPESGVLENVWDNIDLIDTQESPFDANCSPTRVCRNARDFTFEGIATDDDDPARAWRKVLEREGKASPNAESLRQMLLGPLADS